MKTFIVNEENIPELLNLQVAFKVDKFGLMEVVQIEIYVDMIESYQLADKEKYSNSNLKLIEQLCVDWYNNVYWQTA